MRQGGQYVDSGGNAYDMQRMPSQRMDQKSSNYIKPENDKWRWERDGSSHMFNEGMHNLLISVIDYLASYN